MKTWLTKANVVFVGIVCLGLFLRLRPAITTELWLDEASSVLLSRLSFAELIFQNGAYWDYTHPSGYYLLLKVWSLISDQDIWLRMLSVLSYTLSAVIFYECCRKIFGLKTACIASLLFSVHPLFVDLGFQARMYAVTIFFSLAGAYSLYEAVTKKRFLWVMLSIFLLASALYVDYSAIWVMVGVAIITVASFFLGKKNMSKQLAVVFTGVFILYIPQLFVLFHHFFEAQSMLGSVSRVLYPQVVLETVMSLLGLDYGSKQNFLLLTVWIFLVSLAIRLNDRTSDWLILLVFLAVTVIWAPLVVSVFYSNIFIP